MLLELSNITRHFGNGDPAKRRQVLDGISLSVGTGDSIAITGPSGSGKSTLLHIMGILDRPDSGTVRFNGTETGTLSGNDLAGIRNRNMGFVFQLHYLLPQLNLMDNVMLPALASGDRANLAAARRRALDLLDLVGLAGRTGQRPGQMSVGECQRAAVVRALVNGPELVLADEPTGSLDQESALRLGDLLKELNRKFSLAIVVVTHSLELASGMDRVCKLSNGRLTT